MVSVARESDHDEFDAWVQQVLKPRVLARRVRADVFQRAMASARFLPEVLDRQASQKEFSLPIWDYLDIAASDERARNGRAMLRRHRDLFNRIEQAYGVESEVVTAIWGLETGYGVVCGEVPVIAALATLAFRGRRAAFFGDELVAALRIIQAQGIAPEDMVGSWAGAMGHGQFMPSSILGFAVDLDGDGKCDVSSQDPTDALASIANYLKKHDWRKGQPWGFEVRLPEGFDYALSGLDHALPSRDWAALGVTTAGGDAVPDYGTGSILLPAGTRGMALMALRNFHVIMRYNTAEAYAIGIGLLSDRIGGSKPFSGPWPRKDRVMTQVDISELQILLTQAGFDTRGADGLCGPNTLRAVRAFQTAAGLAPDGYINEALLERLRDGNSDGSQTG